MTDHDLDLRDLDPIRTYDPRSAQYVDATIVSFARRDYESWECQTCECCGEEVESRRVEVDTGYAIEYIGHDYTLRLMDRDGEMSTETVHVCESCRDEYEHDIREQVERVVGESTDLLDRLRLSVAINTARAAIKAIPVTDATVNRRAKALAEIEELDVEARR